MTTLEGLDPVQRALCLAARTSVDGDDCERLIGTLGGPFDWDRLWDLAHLHEVVPIVAASIGDLQGVDPPASWRDRATRRRHVTLRVNGHLADTLREVLDAFDGMRLEAMPVKGLVLAETLYGDIGARPCADLDVLVRPADLPAARAALRAIGFRQRAVPGYKALVHPFHDPAWARGEGADHVRLELHWGLWADHEHRLGTDGLWDRSVTSTLQGRATRMLSPEDTLLHLAIHRTRSALRLRWLVDVAELVRRDGEGLDWPSFVERARGARALTASGVVLDLAHRLLAAPVPTATLERLGIAQPKRAILELTCGTTALFRQAADGSMAQQPHLGLRAFEEDGLAHIGSSLLRSALRPLRETLHERGIVRVRPRSPNGASV